MRPSVVSFFNEHHKIENGGAGVRDVGIMHETQPAQRNKEPEDDQRHAQEVRQRVARIMMVGGVGADLLGQGFHGCLLEERVAGSTRLRQGYLVPRQSLGTMILVWTT